MKVYIQNYCTTKYYIRWYSGHSNHVVELLLMIAAVVAVETNSLGLMLDEYHDRESLLSFVTEYLFVLLNIPL